MAKCVREQSCGIWATGRDYKVEGACRPSEETVNDCQMKKLPEHLGQLCLGQNEKLQCGGPGRRRQGQSTGDNCTGAV